MTHLVHNVSMRSCGILSISMLPMIALERNCCTRTHIQYDSRQGLFTLVNIYMCIHMFSIVTHTQTSTSAPRNRTGAIRYAETPTVASGVPVSMATYWRRTRTLAKVSARLASVLQTAKHVCIHRVYADVHNIMYVYTSSMARVRYAARSRCTLNPGFVPP